MAESPDHRAPVEPGAAERAGPAPSPNPAQRVRERAGGDGAPLDPAAETTLWEGRTHWTHFAGSVALGVLAVLIVTIICFRFKAAAGILGIWLVLVLACGAIVAGRIFLRVLSCRYRLTDQRLFIVRGILSQTTDQMDDVRVRQSLPDRLLGLGSVEILSTDLTDRTVVIEGIRSPEAIAEHVRVNMRALRRKSLFIEHL